MPNTQEIMQQLADKYDFDLKKIPYGFQFRIGKLVVNFYDTTGTIVICEPKKSQVVQKRKTIGDVESILKSLSFKVSSDDLIDGKQAIKLIRKGKAVLHRVRGESSWRNLNTRELPLKHFLDGKFEFVEVKA